MLNFPLIRRHPRTIRQGVGWWAVQNFPGSTELAKGSQGFPPSTGSRYHILKISSAGHRRDTRGHCAAPFALPLARCGQKLFLPQRAPGQARQQSKGVRASARTKNDRFADKMGKIIKKQQQACFPCRVLLGKIGKQRCCSSDCCSRVFPMSAGPCATSLSLPVLCDCGWASFILLSFAFI